MTRPFGASDINLWLEEVGLAKYCELFETSEIDLSILGDLTNDDLKELEIPLGDRKRLLKAIARLPGTGQAASTPTSDSETATDLSSTTNIERRQITIMFCDLVGSTELSSQLDPEDVADIMREFQNCCADVINGRGGYVARYQGDAVLAYFGWPRVFGDDAERCVRSGLELAAAIGRIKAANGAKLSARVGIATGLVMVGEMIGEGVAQEEAVVGATPNLAARLESMAKPGTVVVADTTHKLISDYFDLEDMGKLVLKGFPDPVRAWRVERARATTSRFAARVRQGLTPLVGRKSEAGKLLDLWAKAESGQGQIAVVIGEAGIGKSRLVQTLAESKPDAKWQTTTYQCSSFHANSALHPIIEQIVRIADIASNDSDDVKLDKVEACISNCGLDVAETASLLATILAIPFGERYAALSLSPQRQRDKVIDLATELMLRQKPGQAVLIVIEDAHWADPTSLDVLTQLVERIRQEKVLLVVTCRPEFQPEWAQQDYVTTLDLRRLARSSVQAMVKRILGDKKLPAEIMESILSTTDGVPLFVEELTRAVVDSGQLREIDDKYELSDQNLELSIPTTLRDSLAARLDQLTMGKELAQVGATIGRVFSPVLAGYILKASEIELREPLGHLMDAGIIEKRGGSKHPQFIFKHALIQEVAYRSQLKIRRREVHLQIANALESHFPNVAERQPETLGHHFAEAGSLTTAAGYLLQASTKALRVAATGEAIAHLSEGLRLIESLPRSDSRDLAALRFHASLGTAYMLANGWGAAEVEQAYTAANKLSHAAVDVAEAIWILWGIWVHRHVRGQIDEALVLSDRIKAAAFRYESPTAHVVADMTTFQISFYRGHFEDSVEQCLSMERDFVPERDRALIEHYTTDLQLVSLVHRSIASWILGRFDHSADVAAEAEALARSLKHPYSISWALIWGATPYLLRGDTDVLVSKLEEGMAIAHDQGFAYANAMGNIATGWADGRRGALTDGIEKMKSGITAFRTTGAEIVVPFFRTLLAEMLGQAGEEEGALEMLRQTEEQINRWGESWQEPEMHRVRGDILVAGPNPDLDAAEASFRRAIEIAKSQNAVGWRLRASSSLTRLLMQQGKTVEAAATIGPAVESLDEGLETPDYCEAKEIVAQLSNA